MITPLHPSDVAFIFIAIGIGFIVGWIFNFLSFKTAKNKIELLRNMHYGELTKISTLVNRKMKVSVKELSDFTSWLNNELPADMASILLTDIKVNILKDKAKISDKEFIQSFESVLINLQNTVANRAQQAIDNINKSLIEDVKGLINEDILEKKEAQSVREHKDG